MAAVGVGVGAVADFDCCFLGCWSDSGCFVALAAFVVLVVPVVLAVLVALVALVALAVLAVLAGGDAGGVGDAPRCGCGGR